MKVFKAIGRALGIGGGGGGNITYNVPQPAAPTPIDYNAMYAAATRSAIDTMREEEAQLQRLYPTMTGLQFDTVNQLARGLDNEYLQRNRRVIDQELRSVFAPNEIESQIQGRALGDLLRGPTAIQSQLQSDAQRELSLGQSLSPEEMRSAAQSARTAFAARGLGSSLGSAAAEMLNRDAYGRQRQDQRRQFAMGIDQYMQGAETDRRNQAIGANQLDIARRQRRLGLASAYADLDPYARATGPAFEVGSANTGQGLQAIGQAFGNALDASGKVMSFNQNMQGGLYNSWQNNNASVQAANAQAAASRRAGTMGMIGGIGQGALGAAGSVGMGMALAGTSF